MIEDLFELIGIEDGEIDPVVFAEALVDALEDNPELYLLLIAEKV